MFFKNKSRKVSLYLIFIMLFQFMLPIGQVFAGAPQPIPYLQNYRNNWGGEGTKEEPYESRLYPDASHKDYGHRGIAQFKIKLGDGREIISPRENRESVGLGVISKGKTDWSGVEYKAKLGTKLQFENLSTGSSKGGSGSIHFQWYAPDGRKGIFSLNITKPGPMKSSKFPKVLDAPGDWKFYMYHVSSTNYPSANGNHFTAGRHNHDPHNPWYDTYFKQYFTAVKITVPPANSLTVNLTGTGGGTVTKSPNKPIYDVGEEVTVTATPDGGSEFKGFSGDANSTQSSIKVIMDKNKVINAQFDLKQQEAKGDISFSPNSSFEISGNRQGWVNRNINVSVRVEGDTTKEVNGSTSHGYTYEQSHTGTHCVGVDGKGNPIWAPYTYYTTEHGYSSRSYTETWEIASLRVWGRGVDANGHTVSLPTKIMNGTSGTYTISNELKSIYLEAEIEEWKPRNQEWNGGSPPDGSWDGGSPPVGNTSRPTEKYESSSGLYLLDKTKPQIKNVNPTNHAWTNDAIRISIDTYDNLSGMYYYDSYAKLIDTSYYHQPEILKHISGRNPNTNMVISQDGIYELKIKLKDIAQNEIPEKTYRYYKYDETCPDEAQFSYDYRDYIDEDLTVTVTVGDNLSGVTETRYVLNNSPFDTSDMSYVSASTTDGNIGYDSFTVPITEPGSWWIHVYQRDRAGNETWSTSPEYKIIRLGHSDNRNGEIFTGQNDKLWISPLQMNHKVPRATRFDTLLETYGLTESETEYTTMHLTVPKWTDDGVEKKVNGKYAVTSGTTNTHTMNYYSGHNQGSQRYAEPDTVLQWWKAYIAPYGTPVTLDRDGNRLRPKYKFKVQLEFDSYYPNKTHVSTIQFDVIPETKVKTEIIKNEY